MTLTTQFVTIISMIAGGIYMGAAMDTFERLLYKRNKKSIMEFVRQVIFWLLQSAILFYILYQANYGELRAYVFIAVVCGFAAYRSLLQDRYLKALEVCIRLGTAILKTVKKLIELTIIWPVKVFVSIIISLLIGTYKILLKSIFILFIVIFSPIKFILRMIWRMLPNNTKIYLIHIAGFWGRIKNTIDSWKK